MKLSEEQKSFFLGTDYYKKQCMNNDFETLSKLTKDDLLENSPLSFKNKNMNVKTRYVESSGTSGNKGFGWYTDRDLKRMGTQLIDTGLKLTKNDTVLIKFPYALSLPAYVIEAACDSVSATVVPASSRTPITPYFKIIEILQDLKVTVLSGNPREIENIYEGIRVQNLYPNSIFPSLRAIVVAGEVLSAKRKEYLEKMWGVAIYNMYGATELGNFGYTCDKGNLHFDYKNYRLENYVNGSYKEFYEGKSEEIYVTSFNNEAGPHFRFKLEDTISFTESNCSCELHGPVFRCQGRSQDVFKIKDKNYDLYDLQEAIYSLPQIPFYWLVRIEGKPIIEMEFNDVNQVNREEIIDYLHELFQTNNSELEVIVYSENTLIERRSLFEYPYSRKPQYIFNKKTTENYRLLELGKEMMNTEKFDEAEKIFRKIILNFPELSEGYIWLAAVLGLKADKSSFIGKMKIFPELLSVTQKSISMEKYSPFANYLMGVLLNNTPNEVGGCKKKALMYFNMSRYLGYRSDDLDLYIKELINSQR